MKFGRIDQNLSGTIDFSLPDDHRSNREVLQRPKRDQPEGVYVGCARWARPDWVGSLYPKGLKQNEQLRHYAKHFNSIELNPTHYAIPDESLVNRWRGLVDDNFHFCPKVPQSISHFGKLKNQQQVTHNFCASLRYFGSSLGSAFLQLPPTFGPKHFPDLEAFLESWPSDLPLSLELRHEHWYTKSNLSDRLFKLMQQCEVASVITDTHEFRELVHMRLSTPETMIRFVGIGDDRDLKRLDDWTQRIEQWADLGLKRIWFFIHASENAWDVELSQHLSSNLKTLFPNNPIPRPNPRAGNDQLSMF